ncbi:MAG: alpha-ketoacid dehydrogenase subunit beta, partial [Candidatus Bathyarchaeia archaeon]
MREIQYLEAVREALREEMLRDERVFLIGEDIGVFGGAWRVTKGLFEEFGPERVRDTPISETAIIGAAIGAAITGLKPVAEIMYMDFLTVAMDQLINHAAKIHFMTAGKLKVPMVVRTQSSLGRYSGAQHAQFFPSVFMHIPGWKVAVPSTPYDAKGLLKTAIRDENPVMFVEFSMLYPTRGPVPEDEYLIPFGVADVKREGD